MRAGPLTNFELWAKGKVVFSTRLTDAITEKSMFAGRDRERDRLRDYWAHPEEGRMIVISEHMGTGKTATVYRAFADVQQLSPAKSFELTTTIPKELPEVAIAHDDLTQFTRPSVTHVFFDELDVKSTYSELQRAMGLVGRVLKETSHSVLLVGDRCLMNPVLTEGLESVQQAVQFDPMSKDLLVEILSQRIASFVVGTDQVLEVKPLVEAILDAPFLAGLLPATHPGVATPRVVLSVLFEMAACLPHDRERCVFDGNLYIESQRRYRPAMRQELGRFLDSITARLREKQGSPEFGAPMELESLRALHQAPGMSNEEFAEALIAPLCVSAHIYALGVPYAAGDQKNRFPGPYLPGPRTYLAAVLGQSFQQARQ